MSNHKITKHENGYYVITFEPYGWYVASFNTEMECIEFLKSLSTQGVIGWLT